MGKSCVQEYHELSLQFWRLCRMVLYLGEYWFPVVLPQTSQVLQLDRLQWNLYHLTMYPRLVVKKIVPSFLNLTEKHHFTNIKCTDFLALHVAISNLLLPPTSQARALNRLLPWSNYFSVFKTITAQSNDVLWLRNATAAVISLYPSPST